MLFMTLAKSLQVPTYIHKKFTCVVRALLRARDFGSLKQDKHVIYLLDKLSRHVRSDVLSLVLVQPNIQLFTYPKIYTKPFCHLI
jgi:hypothetical protein